MVGLGMLGSGLIGISAALIRHWWQSAAQTRGSVEYKANETTLSVDFSSAERDPVSNPVLYVP